jgi:hypothetical protein
LGKWKHMFVILVGTEHIQCHNHSYQNHNTSKKYTSTCNRQPQKGSYVYYHQPGSSIYSTGSVQIVIGNTKDTPTDHRSRLLVFVDQWAIQINRRSEYSALLQLLYVVFLCGRSGVGVIEILHSIQQRRISSKL